MAVGVLLSNKPIKGSCGGIQALGLGEKCDICGSNTNECEESSFAAKQSAQTILKQLSEMLLTKIRKLISAEDQPISDLPKKPLYHRLFLPLQRLSLHIQCTMRIQY